MRDDVKAVLDQVRQRDPDQKEFLQAVDEVVESLGPLFDKEPKYVKVPSVSYQKTKFYKTLKNASLKE